MSAIVDRLWPLAWPELTSQLEELRRVCASATWRPADTVGVCRIFHTMKSTMVMLEVGTLAQLFASCEKWLAELTAAGTVPDAEGVALILGITEWADIHLEEARRERTQPRPDAALIRRLESVQRQDRD